MRNVFALTSVLEARGMDVVYAENGGRRHPHRRGSGRRRARVMDIMMPELDGYQTIARIRENPKFESLPIISLTAKAMKGDREKS